MADKAVAVTRPAPAPVDVFDTVRRNLDRFLVDFSPWSSLQLFPRLDMTDADGVIEITAELPGLEEKDVDVAFDDGTLTISGEKKSQTEKKDNNYIYSERNYGSFQRRISLPQGVKPEDVKAKMEKGVLTVSIAKPAQAASTKIEVKAA